MTADTKMLAQTGLIAGSGAYRIAEALLETAGSPDEWLSVRELAVIGGIARSGVPRVAMALRAAGADVKRQVRTVGRRDEAHYRVGAERAMPSRLVAVDGPVAA